jgi:uncharacterized Zn-finger protein
MCGPSPAIGVNPPTSVQKAQTSTEASQTANFSSEAFDGDERPSKRRCDPTPLFTCSLCPKSFTRRTTLNSHQRQHTGDRPFLCDFPECGKTFAQNNDKKRHEKTHGCAKTFNCGGTRSDGSPWGCGKAFKRKDGLLEHHNKTVRGGQCIARRDENLELGEDG